MSNLRKHAETELRILGMMDGDEYNQKMVDHLLKMVDAFADEGHTGFSANYAISALSKLLRFEPLSPLTGEDGEWCEVSDRLFQNKRCSHVFKESGVAYDIDGKVFRDPDGTTWTNRDSRVAVTFPYVPTSIVVDRPSS